MKLSAEAFEDVQRVRRAIVEAGPEGHAKGAYFRRRRVAGLPAPGYTMCAVGRGMATLGVCRAGEPNPSPYGLNGRDEPTRAQISLLALSCAVQVLTGRMLPQVNDHQGFDAVVAVLDRVLTECAPLNCHPDRVRGAQARARIKKAVSA